MILQEANRLNSVSEYYFSKKLKELKALNDQGMDIINLGIGSPDMPPADTVVNTLFKEAQNDRNHGYQSYVGIPEFRDAIARYQKRQYNIDLEAASEILPLIGSKEGIMHISMAFLNPWDKVLVPNPGYPTYSSVSKLVSADILTYELDDTTWLVDIDHLRQMPLDEVKIMWVNYPNMPTGEKGNLQQFEQLIKLANKHKFLIVNDNPYSHLFDGSPISIFQAEGSKEVCIELNSLSKSHNMAGWRLGWISGDQEYIKTILKVKSNMDSGMFKPIQMAAIEALGLGEDWCKGVKDIYKKRRQIAFEIMQLLNCTYNENQGGMFVWGKVPDHISTVESWVDTLLHNAKVFITPGFIFGSKGERNIRISLCSPEETLQKALTRLKEVL